jgi:acyl-CoA synthetase (AMP-forming)/AMP-acid ligase II
MSSWSYVDVWRAVGDAQPDAVAIEAGDVVVTWSEFVQQMDQLGTYFHQLGLPRQSTVAAYLYNCPEYLVTFAATLAAGLVPINTNYRYGHDELAYLFDNADTRVIVFHGTFTERIDGLRAQLPGVVSYVHVDDGSTPCPSWATPFSEAVATRADTLPPSSPDDLVMLYTGGTTGMPKGVMWRQDDLFVRLNSGGFRKYPEEGGVEDVRRFIRDAGAGYTLLPACPLMHGTGLFTAIRALGEAGRVVLLTGRHLDPVELASTLQDYDVNVAVIVGDPFARPLLQELKKNPTRYPLASLVSIVSSGAMWSQEIKDGLIAHAPDVLLVDTFGSTEALGLGSSLSSKKRSSATATFSLGAMVRIVNDEGRDVQPGSDDIGKVMIGGRNPLGYYKDPVKSDATFHVIDGVRYSVPGDFAKVLADGKIQLLGRGSQCINTAGEKVFPEEVEEALKTHSTVADACVVGVPHERFGQQVVAAVELHDGAVVDVSELIEHVKSRLASYKAPRHVRIVPTIGRAVNGKMDYARHQREAREWLGVTES